MPDTRNRDGGFGVMTFRLSIARLLLLIAAVGVSLWAFRHASSDWTSLVFTAALALLTYAILGVILRRGGRQAFWIGVAVFGWAYLIACFCPGVTGVLRPKLATTKVLGWLYPRLIPYDRQPAGASSREVAFTVPSPTLAAGVDSGSLRTHRVDVRARPAGGGTEFVLVEDVNVAGRSSSRGVITKVVIVVDRGQEALLAKAEADGVEFILDRHRPSFLEWDLTEAPVAFGAFQDVGHALFALLFAWLGGIAARRLYRLDSTPA